jgi:hypothetical protein
MKKMWIVYGILAVLGLWVLGNVTGVIGSIATAPGRVIQKTMQTNNIIHNYEWFHDTWAAWRAKLNQMNTHTELIAGASGAEANRLRIELAAIRQKCRSLAEQYNANATKTNRSIFQGREAPEHLDASQCEE